MRAPWIAGLLAGSLMLAGCGDDSASSGAASCTELREPEDPLSVQHVVPTDEDTFTYLSDPPTSGPHVGAAAPTGVLDVPLDPAFQVTILEAGAALVQYDPNVIGLNELESWADEGAVVAPRYDLPAPVVVTAWTWKLTCDGVDEESIGTFVATRTDAAPGAD